MRSAAFGADRRRRTLTRANRSPRTRYAFHASYTYSTPINEFARQRYGDSRSRLSCSRNAGPRSLALKLSRAPRRVLVHGHRGARAIYPENTIPAFNYAIEAGADAVEFDVLATRDDVLVVVHDPRINPEICFGPRPRAAIRELTLAELREYDCGALINPRFPKQQPVPGTHVPTLEEVLRLSECGEFQFDIEAKSFPRRPRLAPQPDCFAQLLADQIAGERLEQRVVIQSFDFRVLRAVKRLAPEIRIAALWHSLPRPFVSVAESAGADIVSPHFRLITTRQVQAAHAANLQVVPWTANRPREWQRLIDAGVDGIITDDPAGLIEYLKSEGLR